MPMVFRIVWHCIHTSCKWLMCWLCCIIDTHKFALFFDPTDLISFCFFWFVKFHFVREELCATTIQVHSCYEFGVRLSSQNRETQFCFHTYLLCWNSDRQYVHLTMGKEPLHSCKEKTGKNIFINLIRFFSFKFWLISFLHPISFMHFTMNGSQKKINRFTTIVCLSLECWLLLSFLCFVPVWVCPIPFAVICHQSIEYGLCSVRCAVQCSAASDRRDENNIIVLIFVWNAI